MERVPFQQIQNALQNILLKKGLTAERAELSARLFTEASRDGVYSHGLNRFPRFIEYIEKGYVKIDQEATPSKQMGALEQWDGHLGPGNLNAHTCMERAIELAQTHGIGLVALRNTNHWMRGGAYGWQAAEAGMIGLCWTNTIPNMPAWGAKNPVFGNNPLIIGFPKAEGHIVLDTAMTQFSFGKIESYRRQGKLLPVAGGFDTKGEVTNDPAEIEKSGRALPFGFWKGSGLSLMLDLLASSLSEGLSTTQIGAQNDDEYGLSQLFIAIDPFRTGSTAHYEQMLADTLAAITAAEPASPGEQAYYPGERTLHTREENTRLGIPVDAAYWAQIQAM